MQKVVYSVSKVNKDEKLKGVGYLVDVRLNYGYRYPFLGG